ncbi:MAG: hypothetical protein V2A69_09895 [Pseudomonadota bacterium]
MSENEAMVRDERGRFLPGVSGNPGGTNKLLHKLRELERDFTEGAVEAVGVLKEHLKDPDKRIAQGAAKIFLRIVPQHIIVKVFKQWDVGDKKGLREEVDFVGQSLKIKWQMDLLGMPFDPEYITAAIREKYEREGYQVDTHKDDYSLEGS